MLQAYALQMTINSSINTHYATEVYCADTVHVEINFF